MTVAQAPGHALFDFGQTILLPSSDASPLPLAKPPMPSAFDSAECVALADLGRSVDGDYVVPACPTGFIFTFRLLTTWGDAFYMGLNGLQLLGRFAAAASASAAP